MDPEKSNNESDSLELPESAAEPVVVQPPQTATLEGDQPVQNSPDTTPEPQPEPPSEPNQPADKPPKPKGKGLLARFKSLNVYLLIFIFILVLSGLITFAAYQKNKQSNQQGSSGSNSSQSINGDVLDQLKNTDVTVGQPKQVLSVEANAVFAGSVLIRGDFETAGQIKTEGELSASGLNVSGTGTFQTLQAGKLQLSGDGQIQGNLAVQNSLSVSGSGNFGGTLSAGKLNVQSLELGGDLLISKHISASGGTPGRSNGNALGGGGTSSINGSDTAGTITINTGNSPHPGCFVNVSFTKAFSSPHVVVTPIGSSAASINYYVTRSGSGFSLCTTSSAPAGRNFSFDYIVID